MQQPAQGRPGSNKAAEALASKHSSVEEADLADIQSDVCVQADLHVGKTAAVEQACSYVQTHVNIRPDQNTTLGIAKRVVVPVVSAGGAIIAVAIIVPAVVPAGGAIVAVTVSVAAVAVAVSVTAVI